MSASRPPPALPDHYFRHEFGRLVSVLVRRFGVQRVELCEDAAQSALLRAVQAWPQAGIPDDKGAWLYRVAHNRMLDSLRALARLGQHAESPEPAAAPALADQGVYLEHEVADDLLRLLFVCADPKLPRESQLVLALKTLCGFSTEEIGLRLFQGHEAVHKRLQRARQSLRDGPLQLDTPVAELTERLPAVLQILYLLFNEGYSSAQPDRMIRRELCEEAVRLGLLLAEHPLGAVPQTFALLALMYLHASRFEARTDGAGGLLLIEEQDRALWDAELIHIGFGYLQRSAAGTEFSRYHVEASLAAEHCLAPSYAQTRWEEIARLYSVLDRVAPSALNTLNRAIAVAEAQGAAAGLALVEALKPPGWLLGYYLWDATLGELYRREGNAVRAQGHLQRALDAAPTHAEQALLRRRLALLDGAGG
jgi:RNA polymerase sigma factor (sigma-70 family)